MLHIVLSKKGFDECRKFFDAEHDELFLMFAGSAYTQDIAEQRVHSSAIVDAKALSSSQFAELIALHKGKTITWY